MRPLLHPSLVNGRTGDPALYIETLFEKRAILFDLGDITALSPRKVQRLEHIFVSHAHIDHFVGFDHLLRLLVGREKITSRATESDKQSMPLRALRHVVTVTPGQKIAYVTDVADTEANRKAILDLARNADLLFIEAAFAQADAELAQQRAHLTTTAAGQIAREAGVRRVEPFHFSSRYAGEEARMLNEVRAAFSKEDLPNGDQMSR
jgi:ribonuclease BN (tRNA processing enzyme)